MGLVVCVTGYRGDDGIGYSRAVNQVFLAHDDGCMLRVNVWDGLKVCLNTSIYFHFLTYMYLLPFICFCFFSIRNWRLKELCQ